MRTTTTPPKNALLLMRCRSVAREVDDEEEDDDDEFEEDDEMRCSSTRPLVLQRCKSEPATTAAAKMASGAMQWLLEARV